MFRRRCRKYSLIGLAAVGIGAAGFWYWYRKDAAETAGGATEPCSVQANGHSRSKGDAGRHSNEHEKADAMCAVVQRVADTTTMPSLMPRLEQRILEALDVEVFAANLQQERANMTVADRRAGLRTVTLRSFARAGAVCWALPLVHSLVKVQLAIVGSLIAAESRGSGAGPSQEMQRKFLSLSEHLLHDGVDAIAGQAVEAVEAIFADGQCDLEQKLGEAQIVSVLVHIVSGIEAKLREGNMWVDLLLPAQGLRDVLDAPADSQNLQMLLSVTKAARLSESVDSFLTAQDMVRLRGCLGALLECASEPTFLHAAHGAALQTARCIARDVSNAALKATSEPLPAARLAPHVCRSVKDLLNQPAKILEQLSAGALNDLAIASFKRAADTVGRVER
ncbi:unnamed protein product [Pedinophyceae sp. YPF-701]|nr:unnamed protein product [Pedinophyceae sp. YPF-701]